MVATTLGDGAQLGAAIFTAMAAGAAWLTVWQGQKANAAARERDRERLTFRPMWHFGTPEAPKKRLEMVVHNSCHRPVTISTVYFTVAEDSPGRGSGYCNVAEQVHDLPKKLLPGDLHSMMFDLTDLWHGTTSFVVDTYTDTHTYQFSDEDRRRIEADGVPQDWRTDWRAEP